MQGIIMKIEIITDRRPWANDVKTQKGDIVEVTASEAKAMIANGFALEVAEEKPKAKKAAKK